MKKKPATKRTVVAKVNLEYMRRFFLEWQNRAARIAQTRSGQFCNPFTLSWSRIFERLNYPRSVLI